MSPHRVRSRGMTLCIAALVGMGMAACDGGTDRTTPERPTGPVSTTSSTEPIDLTAATLRAVRGSTTSTSRDPGGTARIAGKVRKPDGSGVEGATVIATWYSVDPPITVRARTDDDGRYELADLGGGRWRVRAYRAPDLATAQSEALFLAADADRSADLSLDDLSVPGLRTVAEPDPPVVGASTSLAVTVSRRGVDERGRLGETAAVGEDVTLIGGDGWSIESASTKTTGFDGIVRWTVTCRAAGAQPLRARVDSSTVDLEISPCAAAPEAPTPTTVAPAGSQKSALRR